VFYLPFERPLIFNKFIENKVSLILGTSTYNLNQKNQEQYYNIEQINFVNHSVGSINKINLGKKTLFRPKSNFGFSEPL